MGGQKKRIVICSLTLQYGGAERVISILSNRLACHYESVELLLYYDREICYDLHPDVRITVVERETRTGNRPGNMLWIRRYLLNHADCVISFLASLNILVLSALMGTGVCKVVADRSDPYRVPANAFLRKARNLLYRTADAVVVQTEKSYGYFPPIVQRKARVIHNPTSVKRDDRGLALRTEKQDLVVCVGRLMAVKDPFVLLSAFDMFHESFPSYRLVWFGEGEMREEMEKWIAKKGLGNCVQLPGTRKDIVREMAAAKMFVMTSKYEGMPNALIEAMSIGLPCICTRVAGAEELIEAEKNGILVPVGGINECRDAMTRVAENGEYAENLGRNAAETADMLDVENIMRQWMEILI